MARTWIVEPPKGARGMVVQGSTPKGFVTSTDEEWMRPRPTIRNALGVVGVKIKTAVRGPVSLPIFEARMFQCTGLKGTDLKQECPALREYKGALYCGDCGCGVGHNARLDVKMWKQGVKCPRGRF